MCFENKWCSTHHIVTGVHDSNSQQLQRTHTNASAKWQSIFDKYPPELQFPYNTTTALYANRNIFYIAGTVRKTIKPSNVRYYSFTIYGILFFWFSSSIRTAKKLWLFQFSIFRLQILWMKNFKRRIKVFFSFVTVCLYIPILGYILE